MKKSTLLHLRIPFSFFLMPVFMLALGISDNINVSNTILAFIILHLLVYPASNGFNSYFDKDEGSIGGLKTPPKVSKELYWVSLVFDLFALVLAFTISIEFMLMIFIYGIISKAYSHPIIRLKKMPFVGWLAAGIFQGYFTFLLSYLAINDCTPGCFWSSYVQIPAILSSILLLGSYPMTQVYQHEEDGKRGDQTISRVLGILGTFHFTAAWFSVSTAGFVYYFSTYQETVVGILFLIALSPVLAFFLWWYIKVRKNKELANFQNTMRLNLISSMCLNVFFLSLLFT